MSQHLSGLLDVLRQGRSYRRLLAQLADRAMRKIAFDIVRSARPYPAGGTGVRLAMVP